MRKTILFFAALFSLAITGCQQAQVPFPEQPIFRDFAVNIGEDGTRSLVSIKAEDFQEACLFAFDAASDEVLTYPEHAGDLEGTRPIAIHTTQKSFNWALPIGRALDIYVIVNYGAELGSTLDSYLADSNLTKSTLNALTFTALDNVYMSDIEAAGIPMSGVVHTTLANENSPVNVTVKRLYARYNLWFDLTDLEAHNATLQALHIVTENVNTEVPFFLEGFKQTDRSKFKQYDRATDEDLDIVQQGGNGHQITLYVPENCQGDIPGATSWKDVAGLGGKVVNCSYVDMDVKIIDQDGLWKNYHVYLYLGTDFKTNFDVRRNYNTTVGIKIPYVITPPDGSGPDYFYWDNHELVTIVPGEEVTLDYATNLSVSDIGFNYSFYETGVAASNAFQVINQDKDKVILKAASDLADGAKFIVTGGNIGRSAQDTKPLQIVVSSVVLEDIDFSIDLRSEHAPYLEVHGNGTQDLVVHVPMNDGGDVAWWVSCRVKYNGSWHTVSRGDSDVKICLGYNEFSWWLDPGYTPGFNTFSTAPSYVEWEMPGDEIPVSVTFNGETVRSFKVYINS